MSNEELIQLAYGDHPDISKGQLAVMLRRTVKSNYDEVLELCAKNPTANKYREDLIRLALAEDLKKKSRCKESIHE